MKKLFILLFLILIAAAVVFYGLDRGATASNDSKNFAPGAFPPTLSDTEYHANAWTRTDCMTCHEKGVQNAPITVHKSLTAEAKEAKCRSCHVFIPGSQPIIAVK